MNPATIVPTEGVVVKDFFEALKPRVRWASGDTLRGGIVVIVSF